MVPNRKKDDYVNEMFMSCKKKVLASQEMCMCFPESLSPGCVCYDEFAEGEAEAAAEGFHFSQYYAVNPIS